MQDAGPFFEKMARWKAPQGKKETEALSPLEEELKGDKAVDFVFEKPEVKSYTTLEFRATESDGRELKPGHRLAFVVPEDFRGRLVRDVILRHRKGEKGRELIGPDGYDPHGAYSRLEARDSETKEWKGWRDPAGYNPVKFAEPRPAHDPENETLHDWLATVGKIKPDAIRVTNVGEHEVYSASRIHGVEVVFFPELDGVTYQERIYCQGTQFIDIDKGRLLPTYGGGEHTEGRYEGAIALNRSGEALYDLGTDAGPGVQKEYSKLILDLDAGKSLAQVEVALGDTEHLASINPKAGRHTRLGWAKLWVGIKRAETGEIDWFIENANIPPQGVIAGGPHLEQNKVKQGDKLIIESRADAAYIMGWRLAYKEAKV